MSVLSLEPLEHFHTQSNETLTAARRSSFTKISLDSHTLTAIDTQVTAIDISKHRIVHLQRFRHVLRLVVLCSSVCWISLALVFLLMIVREIGDPDRKGAQRQMRIYGAVVGALTMAWVCVMGLCLWRFRRYQAWLNDENTRAEWIIAGKQTRCRMSGETIQ
ncbi:hypothetical protein EC988_005458 [Linderina pennispora]|nr:hypothetical protein EC988_005458 [Linderina pennispora]